MAEAIQSMAADDFWGWFIFLTVASIAGLIATFVFFQRARIIEDTPTSKIKSAAQGYVELEGTLRALPELNLCSKLSNTPCVWYAYEIERYVGGKNKRWVTEEKDESKLHFILEDETGRCLVNPVGAAITPGLNIVWYGATKYPVPGSAPSRTTGILSIGSGRYRYTEKRLHAGDSLYALGDFRTFYDIKQIPSLNEEISIKLNRLKQHKNYLHTHYDKNGDGQIDIQEWEQARDTVIRLVRNSYQYADSQSVHVLDRPDERRHPYLLSSFAQHELTGRYKGYSWASLAVFFIAGAISTYMFSIRFIYAG